MGCFRRRNEPRMHRADGHTAAISRATNRPTSARIVRARSQSLRVPFGLAAKPAYPPVGIERRTGPMVSFDRFSGAGTVQSFSSGVETNVMANKQELIQKMIEMQQQFISLEHEKGVTGEEWWNPEDGSFIDTYRKTFPDYVNQICNMAHAEKGSIRD